MIQRRTSFMTSGALCAFMGAALAASPAMAQEAPDATPSAEDASGVSPRKPAQASRLRLQDNGRDQRH